MTSNHGWDTIKEKDFLSEMIQLFSSYNIRTSIFIDPEEKHVDGAQKIGTDRIELYTENYAKLYLKDAANSIDPFIKSAIRANDLGLEVNAGHDLNLENLSFFAAKIPNLKEVSIGHALIADALNYGMENTVNLYLRALRK